VTVPVLPGAHPERWVAVGEVAVQDVDRDRHPVGPDLGEHHFQIGMTVEGPRQRELLEESAGLDQSGAERMVGRELVDTHR